MPERVYPTTKEGQNSYFANVSKYIIANSTRLKIDPTSITTLTTLMGDATTPGTWLYLWPLWANKNISRTTDIRTQLVTVSTAVKKTISKICDDIPVSLWTDTDRNIFKRKKGATKTHTIPTTPITDQCLATIRPLGGGYAKLSFKASHVTSRPCKVKNADGIEIAYKLVVPPAPPADGSDATAKPRKTIISGPDDGTSKMSCSKACSVEHFGANSSGMDLQFFSRWFNLKHPAINGPWTGPFSQFLL